jgi:hypothetical protein
MLTKEKKTELIQKQVDCIDTFRNHESYSPEFNAWRRKTKSLLSRIFGPTSTQLKDFSKIIYSPMFGPTTRAYENKTYQEGLDNSKTILTSMIEELNEFDFESDNVVIKDNTHHTILHILNNFHYTVKQLRKRYNGRATLEIEDEYDVQDLLHALLKNHFGNLDVRSEEWTPSYAGKSTRMDFLLKKDNIIIEVKKTREGLGSKEIGEQLIIDIAHYKNHPNCKKLICFVYDPEERIANSQGLISDLNREAEEMSVEVIIVPM